MTILDILNKLAGAGTGLVAFLNQIKQEAPDLAPMIDEWIGRLGEAVSQTSLVNLASALPSEIANIAQGKIEPKSHPSDAA